MENPSSLHDSKALNFPLKKKQNNFLNQLEVTSDFSFIKENPSCDRVQFVDFLILQLRLYEMDLHL